MTNSAFYSNHIMQGGSIATSTNMDLCLFHFHATFTVSFLHKYSNPRTMMIMVLIMMTKYHNCTHTEAYTGHKKPRQRWQRQAKVGNH